jgi:hypothetical protein
VVRVAVKGPVKPTASKLVVSSEEVEVDDDRSDSLAKPALAFLEFGITLGLYIPGWKLDVVKLLFLFSSPSSRRSSLSIFLIKSCRINKVPYPLIPPPSMLV